MNVLHLVKYLPFYIFLLTILWMVSSCEKEEPYSGPDLEISFSVDTLRFDTVFTTIGSATRSVKIYNHADVPIAIPEIKLSDEGQFFRMNVNGVAGSSVEDVIIQANDSIYIFAEVTIDPDQPLSLSPFIIEEDLVINKGGDTDIVHLEAWGQNANYFPAKSAKGSINLLTCNLGEIIWDDPKPYVIYGVLAIDSCTLTIPEGQHIYVHGGIVRNGESIYNDGLLFFLKDGNLITQGTAMNPVIFEGDRLEPDFDNTKGQWSGIRFSAESRNNKISHTVIKNAIVGVRIDSLAELELSSSMIYNTASSAVIGYFGNIIAENCLFYENGGNGAQLVYGGNYSLQYCTFANYNNQSSAIIATNYRCSDPQCLEDIFVAPLSAEVINCIIDGNDEEEIIMDDISDGAEPELFQVVLQNNLIKSEGTDNNPLLDMCEECIYTSFGDTLFISLDENNYRLDTFSIAESKATPIPGIPLDILGNKRDEENPDIGCYEFQE